MGNKVRIERDDHSHDESISLDGIDDIFGMHKTVMAGAMSDAVSPKTLELPISQAAQALGISERTLWRRVETGKIKSRLKGTKRLVKVPISKIGGMPANATAGSDTLPVGQVGTLIDVKALLHELTAAHYRVGYLQSEVEVKEKQLKLLPDLQAQAARTLAQQIKIEQLEGELKEIKTSWWFRFCSWFLGKRS